MAFPVLVFGIHPHHVFDLLAFFVGGQLFWHGLRRAGSPLTGEQKWTLALGAFVGAAAGAKLVVLLEDPAFTLAHWREPLFWLHGKSIVGAILGAIVGVEWAKKSAGVAWSTGDHWVVPLAVGLAIGRVGCFLSGLTDDAYGVPTTLPWGVDFGDGPRHPTQLYESAFALLALGFVLRAKRRQEAQGDLFRLYVVAYFAFRFLEEFVRVSPRPYLGLTVYQLACAAGLAYYLAPAAQRRRLGRLAWGKARAT